MPTNDLYIVTESPQKTDRPLFLFFAFFIIGVTGTIFFKTLDNGFVNWDNGYYVYNNIHIKKIDLSFFLWSFDASSVSYLEPLTFFSFALDYYFWKFNPFGYHLTNCIIHLANILFVFYLTNLLITKKII